MILHGCAVGGGSITYGYLRLYFHGSPEWVWDTGSWAGLADWKSEMPRYYETARRMLGITENRILGPPDGILKRRARPWVWEALSSRRVSSVS